MSTPLPPVSDSTTTTTPPSEKKAADKSSTIAQRSLSTAAASSSSSCSTRSEKLSLDALYGPKPINPQGNIPKGFRYSPDGKHLLGIFALPKSPGSVWQFNPDGTRSRIVDPSQLEAQKGELSKAEILLQETQRLKGSGITSFQWRSDSAAVLFKCGGRIWEHSLGGKTVPLTPTSFKGMCAKYLPDGSGIAYVENGGFHIADRTGQSLYEHKEDGVTWGQAEYVAAEELNRYDGYWLSPDNCHVALTRVDERGCSSVSLPYTPEGKFSTQSHPYCFAGTPNAIVQLHVHHWKDGSSWQVPLGGDDIYLARVHWFQEGKGLAVQVLNREQTHLKLKIFDTEHQTLVREFDQADGKWVNVHNDIHFLKEKNGFIWKSWQDGNRHLYYYSLKGTKIKRLTKGPWQVTRLLHINEESGLVTFQRTKPGDPTAQEVASISYREPCDPKDPKILALKGKQHSVVTSPDGTRLIATSAGPKQPPSIHEYSSTDGTLTRSIAANPLNETHPYFPYWKSHCETLFDSFEAPDGQEIFFKLTLPRDFESAGKGSVPLMLRVYGGPCVQRVQKTWAPGLEQVLAQKGTAVLQIDNRGSTNRSHRFETAIKGQLGVVELEDQVRGIQSMLERFPQLNPTHVDAFGWSYGGFMTLMMACHYPQVFRKVFSVAPPTDWGLYDTAYTERYLMDPAVNKEGYSLSNPISYLDKLKESMEKSDSFSSGITLCFGFDDPNVLAQNSTEFIAAAIKKGIHMKHQIFPGKMHGLKDCEHYLFSLLIHEFSTPKL